MTCHCFLRPLGETFEQLQHYSKRDPVIKSSVCCTSRFGLGLVFCWHGILSVILPLLAAQFATLQTRGKLGPVNFRKDFWDCYKGRETLDLASLVTIPETIAGHVSAPVPFPFLNANVAIFFSPPYVFLVSCASLAVTQRDFSARRDKKTCIGPEQINLVTH